MPFGFRNASQTFQRFMNQIFHDLDFVYVYIDEIRIASTDVKYLEIVLRRLRKFNININMAKCDISKSSVLFLGHTVTANGILPNTEKIDVILNFKKP